MVLDARQKELFWGVYHRFEKEKEQLDAKRLRLLGTYIAKFPTLTNDEALKIMKQSGQNQQAELGDLLFTLINLARWYDLDADEALNSTNQRFIKRLSLVEQVADRPLSEYTIDELEDLWQQAKAQLAGKAKTVAD